MGKKVTDAAGSQPEGNIIFLKRDPGPGFPLTLFLLLALVLLAAVLLMVQSNLGNERERMLEYMKNRADVLIWTLEGSARTLSAPRAARTEAGHGRRRSETYGLRQLLLEQAALQPAVEYIAICNNNGRVLAHNQPAQVGKIWYSPSEIQAWGGASESTGRYVERNGKKYLRWSSPSHPAAFPGGCGASADTGRTISYQLLKEMSLMPNRAGREKLRAMHIF